MKSKTNPQNPRWIIAEVVKSGNPAGQYPLPVLKQGIRVSFEVEKPTIVPDYFIKGVGGIPIWGKDAEGQTILKNEEYRFLSESIPDEFQSPEGIREFVRLCSERDSEENKEFGPLSVGVSAMPNSMKSPISKSKSL